MEVSLLKACHRVALELCAWCSMGFCTFLLLDFDGYFRGYGTVFQMLVVWKVQADCD